jgi:hypothetical protein
MPIRVLPRPTTSALLKAVFWDKWVGVVTLLWGIYGFLDWLDGKSDVWFSSTVKAAWDEAYRLPPMTWQTWVMVGLAIITFISLHGAYRYASNFSRRYEDITKHKITFEVDEGQSEISFKDVVTAKIVLRFENTDIHQWSMKKLDFTLHEVAAKNTREFFTMYRLVYRLNDIAIPSNQFEGMMLEGGELTPYYEVNVFLSIVDKDFKGFENTEGFHLLRIQMDASNQPMYTSEFYLSVDKKMKTAKLRSFSQSSAYEFRQRIRRIG